uniref:Dynein light chain Tctex-type 3 n=1 Tax=Molossus molossus TaxID=27622 RepID=A0A7J8J781_MOLMO|nr:dynein light chain Tctex-type 3 [Molossus molossus]
MEEYHRHCDEVGFNSDEAHNIVKECIDGVLGGEDYNQNNINQWTASIVEQSLAHLVKLGKAYKYIVTCAVVQRSAYGFHTASSCFWDTTSDGMHILVQLSCAATRGQKDAIDWDSLVHRSTLQTLSQTSQGYNFLLKDN